MVKIRIKEYYIFIPLLIAYFVLYLIFPFLSLVDIVKFILFQFLFLFLPGYIFSKWLISEDLTKIQRLILGYPVSMVLLFILSWISRLLHIPYLEAIILLVAARALFEIFAQDKKKVTIERGKVVAAGIFFYGVCVIISFRLFILPSAPPTATHLGLYYQDSLWTIGNTWAYIRGLPLEDARFAGVLFGYHILQNVYQAAVFGFTGIDPFFIHFYLEPIFDWFLAVFLVLYGGIKILKLTLRQIVIFCIGLFFTSSFFVPGFQADLFVNPLSFYFGLPVFILFIFYIVSYLTKQRELDIIYLTALFIYFTATKAVLGLVVPMALTLLFIKLYGKKFLPREFLLIFGLFIACLFLKFTIFKNTIHKFYYDYDTSASAAYALFKEISFIRNYADIIYPFYRFFSSFTRYVFRSIFNWPFLLFFAVFSTSNEFRKKMQVLKNPLFFIFIFCTVTMALGSLFNHPSAVVYYSWYPQVIFIILGTFTLDFILNIDNLKYQIFAVLLLLVGVSAQIKDLSIWVKNGFGSLPKVKERVWDKRASINYDEWQAMRWLERNTGPQEIFFTDRRYFTHELHRNEVAGFRAYTALSGRRAFAEGEGTPTPPPGEFMDMVIQRWNLVNRFLSSRDCQEQEDLLKSIAADYFVQSLRFDNRDFSKISNLSLIYENNSVRIFRVGK